MKNDPKVLILGQGVANPTGIFETTLEAAGMFPDRVMETPLSESMITGACLGLALEGWKPVLVHARCDWLMTAMEHMVNTVAKWRQVHNDRSFSLVVRALVGRGWGQGPNHSQAFHAMFAQVPGLRVLYPVDPECVASWLEDALSCGRPTLVMEPRRLYDVEKLDHPYWENPDVNIITFGDAVLDAGIASKELAQVGIKAQVCPIEDVSAMRVPQGTVPAIVVDTGHLFCGAAAEVLARLVEQGNVNMKRVGPPFTPLPTSVALEREWYPSPADILTAVGELLGVIPVIADLATAGDERFRGPF
jgi:pyruvate dehydrogenase E1 component beta subunit